MRLCAADLPRDLLKNFNINEKGIRVVEVEIATIDELYPQYRGRQLRYHVPRSEREMFSATLISDGNLPYPSVDTYEHDEADFVLELKLYLTKEKLWQLAHHNFHGEYPKDDNIAGRKVKDCSVRELLYAISKQLER